MGKDYYGILGVEKGSSKEQIKKAYKKLAMKYHPDKASEDKKKEHEEKFKEINEAAAVLGDEKKRQHYDQFGTADPGAGFGGQGMGGFDFSSFADFGDIFDQFFGGSRRSGGGVQRGSDLLYELEVTLEEAAFGTEKKLVIPRMETCSSCDGSGAHSANDIVKCETCGGRGREQRQMRTPFGVFAQTATCRTCRGEGMSIKRVCEYCDGMGRTRESRKIDVNIPAGVDNGMRLRVSGEGEAGVKGGPQGDLFVQISVTHHDVFLREGDDINLEMPVAFSTVALGGTVDVPTLHGTASLKIPEGTQSNTVFRMKGKGMPSLQGGTGNQMVRVVVEVPTKLSTKQKELIEKFEATKPKRKKGLFEGLF